MAAFIGLWFSTVGADMVTNQLRFTFGNTNLYGGRMFRRQCRKRI